MFILVSYFLIIMAILDYKLGISETKMTRNLRKNKKVTYNWHLQRNNRNVCDCELKKKEKKNNASCEELP